MENTAAQEEGMVEDTTYFDVMVIGAGLSGIGAGVRLQRDCPDATYAILERREAIGGTWDIFRYPGIRSDSDMHTLGYDFKPWSAEKAIADGTAIREYVNATADEYGVREHIHFQHQLKAANWCSELGQWILSVETPVGLAEYRCNVLLMCAGYYSYDEGYQPDFAGKDSFDGTWVHPQFWPQDLDYANKKVVVIGSGATAMTLVPNMASKAEHVTMLQRSPTYVISRPSVDAGANWLRKHLPEKMAYALTRWRNTVWQQFFYGLSRVAPSILRRSLLKKVKSEVGDILDVEKHFTPDYNPWDQRLCLVPDDDLFEALKTRKADVVTDHIAQIDAKGILLKSGQYLEADVIVSATGLNLLVLGGAEFSVDGKSVDFSKEWTYKGMMCSNVPNMIQTFGYINASWTLRADLIAHWTTRVVNHLKATGNHQFTPRISAALDQSMPKRLWIDDFSAGYMQRVMHLFPKQGDQSPWVNPQNFRKDRQMFRDEPLEDGALKFEQASAADAQNSVEFLRAS